MDGPVRAWVLDDFGIALDTLDEVGHGADANARLWRARAAGGTEHAVKLSGGGTAAGLRVAAELEARGTPGVLAPARTPGGRPWSDRDGRRLSVVPWASDARALDGGMDAARWRAYGELLRQVHDTPPSRELAAALPRETNEHERLTAAARRVEARMAGGGSGARAGGGAGGGGEALGGDPLTRALADAWTGAHERIAALVERADALERALRERPAERVLCHGDPHLGNVLLGDGARVWLIDWDDALLAPRERDLLFAIGGVLPFAPVTPQQQAWFFDGYGAVDVDPERLAYHRCVRALEDLGDPAEQVLDRDRWSEAERAQALEIACSVLSPTGLARLALAD